MADFPATNFDLIEEHKENIQPMRGGRSARALAASLSPLSVNPHTVRSERYARQSEFEEELQTAAELDDPLDVWLRYMNWTVETFPAGNSSESGLLPLLERATREFVHDNQYKNDPRYLKLWVQYAQQFSDAPREVFAYLARNDIGQRLALFYEEYAGLLESLGRKNQAAEIFQSGIENNATPLRRLQRKYDEFLQRLEGNPPAADEPSSPALPTVRPALAAKPFGGPVMASSLGAPLDLQRQAQPPTTKPVKQKMAIFSDDGSAVPERASGGWQNIGSLQHRKKENAQEPISWAGQILRQQQGRTPAPDRLMVFRDNDGSIIQKSPSSMSISTLGKRPELIAANLELVYPEEEEGQEFCFEELRAKSRGLYGIDWNAQRKAEEEDRARRQPPLDRSRTPIKVKTILSPSPNKGKIRRRERAPPGAASPTMTFHTKAATNEIYDIFNQPLKKLDSQRESGDSDESVFGNESDEDFTTTSLVDNPNRMEARDHEDEDDVESVRSDWSDFNLAKSITKPVGEDEEEGDEADEDDTFAVPDVRGTTSKMQKLSIFTDDPGQSKPKAPPRKLQIPAPPDDFDPPTLPYHIAKDQSHMQSRLPYMTPIVERTESLPGTIARYKAMQASKTPSRGKMPVISDDDMVGGSPFWGVPNEARRLQQSFELVARSPVVASRKESVTDQGPIIDDKVCNPMDVGMRRAIFQKLQPTLETYDGYAESTANSGRAAEIKKFSRAMSKRDGGGGITASIPESPLLEFITSQRVSSYTVKKELGKGAFAPVYLVENNIVGDAEEEAEEEGMDPEELDHLVAGRKRWEALKMEDPPNPWEFYMVRQAKRRLGSLRAAESIVAAHEMHLFADEGFLLLEYRDQGTILDLVNFARAEPAGVMEELLAMFLAVELFRTTEGLHKNALIHGDLKSDNCLIRFDSIPDNQWSSKYQPDGSFGWSKKGVTLIDFGRGIDMRLFQPGVQFIADWKTDQQDCAEMREMRPWTYQVDYYGLAAIIHSMLFGKYIQTIAERSGLPGGGPKNYKITAPLKRYWEKDIWAEVFDVLLNPLQHGIPEEDNTLPITASLKRCRKRMEAHLVAHCDKGIGLKSMIRKMEAAMGKRK